MISTRKPVDFAPQFHVSSCFVEQNGKILLLLRLPSKSEGSKWGVPAGKIDPGESPLMAVLRETKEETKLDLTPETTKFFRTYYVRYPSYDFVYHVYSAKIPADLTASHHPREHQQLRWTTPQEALQLDLVTHQDVCIQDFYNL